MIGDRLAAELLAGTPVIVQRVPPTVDSSSVAAAVRAALGVDVEVCVDPFQRAGAAVVDLRGREDMTEFERRRAELSRPGQPLVLLADLRSSKLLLQQAPQMASWAGGVRLPEPPSVRPSASKEEVELGRQVLARALAEGAQLPPGTSVGVNLADGRLFRRRGDHLPLQQAQEELDEGIIYVGRVSSAVR